MRTKKYPNAKKTIQAFYEAVSDSYNNPGKGETGDVSGKKKQELLAEEFGISRIKVRKILITIGDVEYPETKKILALLKSGLKMPAIAEHMGMALSTVISLTPYTKGVYKLSDVSAAAERTERYRLRLAAVNELQEAVLNGGDWSLPLWKAIVLFAGYPFMTAGRGKERRGAIKFTYSISKAGGSGGRHYAGASVDGFGNEMIIAGKEKTISRSTVEVAMRNAQEKEISGPRSLGVPGAHSYLYPILLRFGVIASTREGKGNDDND